MISIIGKGFGGNLMDLSKLPIKNGIRLRGTEITRLETFTDAAFAFAVTMLVIAGDSIPTNYQTLMLSLKDIPSFAASIVVILFFWHGHVDWSRRYGLEDGPSIVLSGGLILSLLVFVYPLKLVFSSMFSFFSGGLLQSAFVINSAEEISGLFVFYGLGFFVTCIVIVLLYLHALGKREVLQLNDREIFETKAKAAFWCFVAGPAIISVLCAWLLPARLGVWSGFIYWLYPVITPAFGILVAKKRKRFISD